MTWLRFGVSAAFALIGVAAFISAAVGVSRFSFVLNRMHTTAVADTVGIASLALCVIVYMGFSATSAKELAAVALMMLTSPVASHLLAEIEFLTGERIDKHCRDTRTEDESKDD